MLKKLFGLGGDNERKSSSADLMKILPYQTYFYEAKSPSWSSRNYNKFAEEGYSKNVIVHRSISLIATSVGAIKWSLFDEGDRVKEVKLHPVLQLLSNPNPSVSASLFLESIVSQKLIGGNCFVAALRGSDGKIKELYNLHPEKVKIEVDKQGFVSSYIHAENGYERRYRVDKITGRSDVLHLKCFNPHSSNIGLSPIEAAAYSIDQHNQAASWNQSLLQNGAKPSGALVVNGSGENGSGHLSDEQFMRLKQELEENYSGYNNAGKPLLLEGGLDWKEMSISPKDMDFIESKNMSAREIALAFGVPPQLLGIPGDNTFNNLAEARLALWEQTILPLMEDLTAALNTWLLPNFSANNSKNKGLKLSFEKENIPALLPRREKLWARLQSVDFLTTNEKRKILGFPPLEEVEGEEFNR